MPHTSEYPSRVHKARAARLLVGLAALSFVGCSTVSLNCPSDHVVTATLNGPDYAGLASQIVALLAPYLGTGGLLGEKLGATASSALENDGTLTIKTLDFGTQSYACGNLAPSTPVVPAPAPVP